MLYYSFSHGSLFIICHCKTTIKHLLILIKSIKYSRLDNYVHKTELNI